jgi:hypothetical protein
MAEQLSMIRALALLPLMALTASCATLPDTGDDRAALDEALEGKVAGKAQSCITLDEARGATIYRDAIVYRASRRLSYVNASPGCRSNEVDPIFVNDVFGSRLCRGDVVRTISRFGGMPGPFCILGDFTPYRTPRGEGR